MQVWHYQEEVMPPINHRMSSLQREVRHLRDGRQVTSLYYGRSSRCMYTRVKEHEDGYAKRKEENPL